MAKLKKNHFYYGAILDALCQYNPDASPILMSHEEEPRQVYKVMTNTSRECILFFKYASPKTNGKNEDDISYLFTFSDDDKQKLKSYNDRFDYPIFLYLLCKQPDLKDSEIIVLKYEEYQNVEENRAITIRIQKNKNYILLFKKGSKSPDNAYQIQRNRIEKTFDELMSDFMKESSRHLNKKAVDNSQMDSLIATDIEIYKDNLNCPFCGNFLEDLVIHNSGNDMVSRICIVCKRRFVNKRQYKVIRKYCGANKIIPELYIMDYPERKSQNNEDEIVGEFDNCEAQEQSHFRNAIVKQLFVMEQDRDTCPIHNCKMDIKVMNFGVKLKDTVHFCKRCNKHIISQSQYDFLKKQTIKNSKRIIQNISFEKLNG